MLEHVQVRVDRLAAVQVEAVLPFPAERLAGHLLQPGEIDPAPAEYLLDVRAEVLADDGDDAHLGEERRGDGEIGRRAADDASRFAERSLDGIERDGTDSEDRVHERYFPMMGARSFLTCAGTASGRVMSAYFSAEPHSQERATGSFVMASAIARCAVWAFCVERLHDHLDGHRVVVRVPAVVVGDERQRDVADLRFAGELRFLQVRHADDVHAPRSVQLRLGERGELRPLHADVGAAAMHVRADGRNRSAPTCASSGQIGMRERHVRGESAAEERADARLGPIEKLIGHDDVERRVLLLEAADRAGGDDPLDAEHLEPEDVRAEIQLGRQQPVARAVPREKRDALAAQRAQQVRARRIAERRLQRPLLAVGQLGHVVQAAAADDANLDGQ